MSHLDANCKSSLLPFPSDLRILSGKWLTAGEMPITVATAAVSISRVSPISTAPDRHFSLSINRVAKVLVGDSKVLVAAVQIKILQALLMSIAIGLHSWLLTKRLEWLSVGVMLTEEATALHEVLLEQQMYTAHGGLLQL